MMPDEKLGIRERDLRPFNPDKLLPHAERLPREPILGMLGFSGSGKTVFCVALLHFINDIHLDPTIKADLEEGSQYIAELKDIILTDRYLNEASGKLKTQPNKRFSVKARISIGDKSVWFYVNDISGETFSDLLNMNDDDAVISFLSMAKSEGKTVGEFAYLPYCKAYALTISCDINDYRRLEKSESTNATLLQEWARTQSDYTTLLQKLLAAKNAFGSKRQRGFLEPLAIVFTKTDQLPPELLAKDGAELLDLMSDLKNYIYGHFDTEKIACLKTCITFEGGRPKIVNTEKGPRLDLSQSGFQDFLDWLKRSMDMQKLQRSR